MCLLRRNTYPSPPFIRFSHCLGPLSLSRRLVSSVCSFGVFVRCVPSPSPSVFASAPFRALAASPLVKTCSVFKGGVSAPARTIVL